MKTHEFKKRNREKIEPGDIFSFQMDEGGFGFGRIVSRINDGHVAEIFNVFSKEPVIDLLIPHQRFSPLVVLDSYGLFQRKSEGNWGFVGKTENYIPDADASKTKFAWGVSGNQKSTDIFDRVESISDAEASLLPRCSPKGDFDVKEFIKASISKSKK